MFKRKLFPLILAMAVASMGATLTRDNTAQIGDDVGGTSKTLKLGPLGHLIWSGSKMQVTNDGGTNKIDIGSGGGGQAGINILATRNADMETVSAGKPSDWTESAGTLTSETTNVHDGEKALSWDAAASADTLSSAAVNIDANEFGGLKGENCTLFAYYLASTISSGDYKMEAVDGSANVLASVDLVPTPSGTWQRAQITFPCPFGTTLKAEFEATTNADVILVDSVFMGRYDLFQVSQAKFVGSSYFPVTGSCNWTRTNSALGAFGTTAACPGPTIDVQKVGLWQTTDTDLPKQTINNLSAGTYLVIYEAIAAGSTGGETYSIAINDGSDTRGISSFRTDASGLNFPVTATAWFEYDTAGDRTFEIYGSGSAGTITLQNSFGNARSAFTIIKFPLSSQETIQPNTVNRWGVSVWNGVSTDSITAGTFTVHDDASFSGNVTRYGGASAPATATNLGHTISNIPAGDYEVYYSGPLLVVTDLTVCTWDIYDGSNSVAVTQIQLSGTESRGQIGVFRGFVSYGSFQSSREFTVRAKRNSGSGSCALTAFTDEKWTLAFKPIGENIPVPLLVNSIVSSYNGVSGSEWIEFGDSTWGNSCTASPCTIHHQSGAFSSVTRSGQGQYVLNANTGVFAGKMSCTCHCRGTGTSLRYGSIGGTEPTNLAYYLYVTDGATPSVQDANCNCNCKSSK
jgi:hypothetical protein